MIECFKVILETSPIIYINDPKFKVSSIYLIQGLIISNSFLNVTLQNSEIDRNKIREISNINVKEIVSLVDQMPELHQYFNDVNKLLSDIEYRIFRYSNIFRKIIEKNNFEGNLEFILYTTYIDPLTEIDEDREYFDYHQSDLIFYRELFIKNMHHLIEEIDRKISI